MTGGSLADTAIMSNQVSGQLGALIGVFIAGPLTNWLGYRWATITGLMTLNGFIFIFYFASQSAARRRSRTRD